MKKIIYPLLILLLATCAFAQRTINVSVKKNSTATLTFWYGQDVSGKQITFRVYDNPALTGTPKLTKQNDIAGGLGIIVSYVDSVGQSKIVVSLSAVETASFPNIMHHYTMIKDDALGGNISTIFKGKFAISPLTDTTYYAAMQKLSVVIANSEVTSFEYLGFALTPTYTFVDSLLTISSAGNELNLAGILTANDYNFNVVPTPTTAEITIDWDDVSGTKAFVWEYHSALTYDAYNLYGTSGTGSSFDSLWVASALGNKANITLNNLGTTAINTNLIPATKNTYTLGALGKGWASVMTQSILFEDPELWGTILAADPNPTSLRIISLPNKSGTVMLTSDTTSLSNRINLKLDNVFSGYQWLSTPVGVDKIIWQDASDGIVKTTWLSSLPVSNPTKAVLDSLGEAIDSIGSPDNYVPYSTYSRNLFDSRTGMYEPGSKYLMLGEDLQQAVIGDVSIGGELSANYVFTGTLDVENGMAFLPNNFYINGAQLLPTVTELNYVDGVTSNIQTQLNARANATLSNLGTTAINSALFPNQDGIRALGSANAQWHSLWLSNYLGHQGTSYPLYISFPNPTNYRTIDFPDKSGTIAIIETPGLVKVGADTLATRSYARAVGGTGIGGDGIWGAITGNILDQTDLQTQFSGKGNIFNETGFNNTGILTLGDNSEVALAGRIDILNGVDITTTITNDDDGNLVLSRGLVADKIDIDSVVTFFKNSTELDTTGIGKVSGEINVRDDAGNITVISPHPVEFDGKWMYLSQKDGVYTAVDWEKFISAMEKVTGEKYIYKGKLEDIKKEMQQ